MTTAIREMLHLSVPSGAASTRDSARVEAERPYLVGRGYLLGRSRDLTRAIEALGRGVQTDDRHAMGHALLGEAYFERYRQTRESALLDRARSELDEAVTLDPLDARIHVGRGRMFLNTGQGPRAVVEFKAALDLDTDAPGARNQLAAAYEANGKPDLAEEEYRRTIALHPKHWSSYFGFGGFLYRQGRFPEAEEADARAVELAPANWQAILNLAADYEAQERYAAAEIELTKGLNVSPHPFLYNNLAWIYVLQERFGDAAQTMTHAVEDPDADSITRSTFARACRWAGGREKEASLAYSEALRRADAEVRANPFNVEARGNRAFLLAETHRSGDAVREIDATLALEGAKGIASVLFYSALVHEFAGDRRGALEALEQAARGGYPKSLIERDPDLKQLRKDRAYPRVLEMTVRRPP